jgi:hypothetical protein
MAEIQHAKALHLNRFLTGTGKQAADAHRHIAEQRTKLNRVVALAGQPAPAGRTAAALLARRGHLRRNNLGLKCRGQPFRFGEPKPKVSQASVRVALDAGHLGLRQNARAKLRHQLHPPHQLRHQTHLPREPRT